MAKRFCVVYRKGGPDNFCWYRSIAFQTSSEALDVFDMVNRGGYPGHVEDYDHSMSIGLPETYAAHSQRGPAEPGLAIAPPHSGGQLRSRP